VMQHRTSESAAAPTGDCWAQVDKQQNTHGNQVMNCCRSMAVASACLWLVKAEAWCPSRALPLLQRQRFSAMISQRLCSHNQCAYNATPSWSRVSCCAAVLSSPLHRHPWCTNQRPRRLSACSLMHRCMAVRPCMLHQIRNATQQITRRNSQMACCCDSNTPKPTACHQFAKLAAHADSHVALTAIVNLQPAPYPH
jgi:hypothetical protein